MPCIYWCHPDGFCYGKSGMSLISVHSMADLDRIGAFRGGLLVFKHSPRCSISGAALHRVRLWLERNSDVDIAMIDVLADRPLSRELEAAWQVVHQSPQMLWRGTDGSVRHESHFGIDADWLDSLN